MKRLLGNLICAATLLLAGGCAAQTGIITWQQPVFTNQTSNGYSGVVRNINQASHWVTYCWTGTGSGQIQIVASNNSTSPSNAQVISNVGILTASASCGVIQAGGYFSNVWAQLLNVSGGISVTATYSASTAGIPTPSNVGLAQAQNSTTVYAHGLGAGAGTYSNQYPLTQCDIPFTVSVASNTDQQLVATASTGLYVCEMVVSGVGGTSVGDALYNSTSTSGCAEPASAELRYIIPATNWFELPFGNSLGWIMRSNGTTPICYHHGSSGAAVQVSILYTHY